MVGYRLYRGGKLAVPQPVEGICARVIAKPVDPREPHLLTVLIEDLIAVGMQPVITLNGVLISGEQRLYIGCCRTAAVTAIIAVTIVILLLVVILLILIYLARLNGAVLTVKLSALDL